MSDIPPQDLLQHMLAFEQRINGKFDSVNQRFDVVDHKIERVEARIERAEANLTRQIDAIDKRLDDVEIEKLPERVRKLEMESGLSR